MNCRTQHDRRSRRELCIRTAVLAVVVTVGLLPASLRAGSPVVIVCGDATGDGVIASSDALVALRTAVGTSTCEPSRCDANASGAITATDASTILKCAVGQDIALHCPAPDPDITTTTSTTVTTTTSVAAVCGNGELEAGEDCEPSESFCRGGCNLDTGVCVDFMCSDSCRCPPPLCGDWLVDPGEDCDPPGSQCGDGTCTDGCRCEP
ncbi:MAG TPA: dockerin type I repeat-containing protein [Candidatus Limnocylindrales bacterium]|nr:dockerin type I repeat-containing protein [Candidatus Limnocylindrales bacterium]